jgi:hypothetical protein
VGHLVKPGEVLESENFKKAKKAECTENYFRNSRDFGIPGMHRAENQLLYGILGTE